MRIHNRLIFALCRTCVESQNPDDCAHEALEDRVLVGTWVSAELQEAVRQNYKIIKIHEIHHYEKEVYDSEAKKGGVFAEYVNTFLKLKTEASGWSSSCVDDPVAQDRFIEEYREKEGVELSKEKMVKNNGMRTLSKLMLNSLWSKMSQREKFAEKCCCKISRATARIFTQ